MLDLADSTFWWVAAGALVAIELATGTFYLLMLALGLAAAALTAHAHAAFAAQIAVAALVGGGTVAAWHVYRIRKGKGSGGDSVQLDVGEKVQVTAWGDDGTARVQYRGAAWTAIHEDPAAGLQPGWHVIKGMQGNRLVLGR
ncbi:MAG TPA: NfeD family protein [Aquabacterium sp.]|uniref:NfeD family protein n=1 Tax=Aquabacterium sp. TaxID=1872578 RepID=UPI002E330DA2|nr:NfeD family protein [Aquabacterium sp.]HEX5356960.1 NfeD family protein [Aquabacterium sp.]